MGEGKNFFSVKTYVAVLLAGSDLSDKSDKSDWYTEYYTKKNCRQAEK